MTTVHANHPAAGRIRMQETKLSPKRNNESLFFDTSGQISIIASHKGKKIYSTLSNTNNPIQKTNIESAAYKRNRNSKKDNKSKYFFHPTRKNMLSKNLNKNLAANCAIQQILPIRFINP